MCAQLLISTFDAAALCASSLKAPVLSS